MDLIKIYLTKPINCVEVTIERKCVKKIRLKIFPNGTIKLSAPLGVSDKGIEDFLQRKTAWIEKSLLFFKDAEANEFETRIHSGVSTRILGRQIRIVVNKAMTYKVNQKEDCVLIQSPVIGDKQALQKQFDRWWQKQAKSYFQGAIDKIYPIIGKHGIDKPTLHVRKMKTLWGSCSKEHRKINLNYYLYKAPPPCIDYVILHELTHFLYPRHNKDFYEFLTVHMPDWKERKKILDYEIVKGLRY